MRHTFKKCGTDGTVCGGHRVADPFPASLQAALADLAKWLEVAHISMIIGGVAASALGRPRLTQDIDALAIVPDMTGPMSLKALLNTGSFHVMGERWSLRIAAAFFS